MLILNRTIPALLLGIALAFGAVTTSADEGGKVIIIPLFDDSGPTPPGGSVSVKTIYVAKSGGDFTSPQAAMNSIKNSSASNRYRIFVAPGEYQFTSNFQLKPYVHVEGSGKYATLFIGSVSGEAAEKSASLISGDDGAALSHLTLINDTFVLADQRFAEYTIGIFNLNTTIDVKDVDVYVSSTAPVGEQFVFSVGVFNNKSASTYENVTVLVDALDIAYGAWNTQSTGSMKNVLLDAYAQNRTGYGTYNTTIGSMKIEDSEIYGSTFSLVVLGSAAATSVKNTLIGGGTASTPGKQCIDTNGAEQCAEVQCVDTYDEGLQGVSC